MISVHDFQTGLNALTTAPLAIAYISMPNCSVCVSVKPQLIQHLKSTEIPIYQFDAVKMPEVAGEFQVLTAPAILLFAQGKEVARQARFIDFDRLKTTVENYQTAGNEAVDYQALFEEQK